jgi:hypothetical protein
MILNKNKTFSGWLNQYRDVDFGKWSLEVAKIASKHFQFDKDHERKKDSVNLKLAIFSAYNEKFEKRKHTYVFISHHFAKAIGRKRDFQHDHVIHYFKKAKIAQDGANGFKEFKQRYEVFRLELIENDLI